MLRIVAVLALLTACVVPVPPAPTARPVSERTSSEHRIITGVDSTHTIITEPLVETIPHVPVDAAQLSLSITNPAMVSLEGTVYFLQAATDANPKVLDRIINPRGDRQPLPAGNYTLIAYYRGCDRNCGLLDPPGAICEVDAVLAPERAYELVVDMESGTCDLA
jgi:hypothetical protein